MGQLKGKQLEARKIAALCYEAGWRDAEELITAVAVCLSESQGYMGAVNDNKDDDGNIKSRDCGLFQINIGPDRIGTEEETRLFEDAEYNVSRAWALYERRGFQPWYAWTLNVYTRDTYIERASRGTGNFLAEILLSKPTDTLKGQPYVHQINKPVLNLQRRVGVLAGGCSRAEKILRDLRSKSAAPTDAQLLEVITILAVARNQAKR